MRERPDLTGHGAVRPSGRMADRRVHPWFGDHGAIVLTVDGAAVQFTDRISAITRAGCI